MGGMLVHGVPTPVKHAQPPLDGHQPSISPIAACSAAACALVSKIWHAPVTCGFSSRSSPSLRTSKLQKPGVPGWMAHVALITRRLAAARLVPLVTRLTLRARSAWDFTVR
jgi:hypothetical protein